MHTMNIVDRGSNVNSFCYTDEILDDLEVFLSRERLGAYLDADREDREGAVRLHVWNTAVSAAFYGPLQGLEIALRNAMNRALGEQYGEAWYDDSCAGFDRGALERIANAKKAELARDRHRDDPHRVVAALSFGFWVSLLGPGGRMAEGCKANYQMTLWRPALRGAFPHRASLTRKQAHRSLNALRRLRNRIAHHEPIFKRNLREDHKQILEIAGWMSPATRAWIEHHSRVPAVLENAKAVGDIRF